MAISAIGEGCHKQMVPILDEIMMGGVLPFLRDQVIKRPFGLFKMKIATFCTPCKIISIPS